MQFFYLFIFLLCSLLNFCAIMTIKPTLHFQISLNNCMLNMLVEIKNGPDFSDFGSTNHTFQIEREQCDGPLYRMDKRDVYKHAGHL